MSQFTVPAKILIGRNLMAEAQGLFPEYGKKALIVTGKHVARSVMMSQLQQTLREAGVEFVVFDGITSEPTDVMISLGVESYKTQGCDFLIGIGGGSPLDSAKAIAAMITNPGEIADYNGRIITNPVPPIVAIPTTAGTGSEVTKMTIITDVKKDIKMLLKGDVLVPSLAIVDYDFGAGAPKSVTAATGLDALTHAIESYISKRAMPLTDTYAVSAIRRIIGNLPAAYAEGQNSEAREQMAIAALEAGICINNSSVTVVHGMSRPIGAMFHVPHGISNAMLLCVCLKDMINEARERLAQLARALDLCSEVSDERAAGIFVDKVAEICHICQVPTLKAYGIDSAEFEKVIDKMAADAIASGSPANAPKDYSAGECIRLYREAFGD